MIFIQGNKFHITVRTVPGLVIYFVALAFYFASITVFNLKTIFRMIVSGIRMEGIHLVVDGIAFAFVLIKITCFHVFCFKVKDSISKTIKVITLPTKSFTQFWEKLT